MSSNPMGGMLPGRERVKVNTIYLCHEVLGGLTFFLYQKPGNSAGDLFGMVSARDPFQWLFVTSNWGIKRSL